MQIKQLLTLATAALLIGCGGNNASTGGGAVESASRAYVATQQPGDIWSWTLSATSFSGTNETLGHTYSGDVQVLPSGFSSLTITSSNDDAVAAGSKAYAVEIPGTCILVRPAGGDGVMPIIGTGLGSNPTADTMSMNWITIPKAGFQVANDDAFGIADFTKSGGGYHLDIHYGRLSYESGDLQVGIGATLTDTNGRFLVTNDDGSEITDDGRDVVFGLQASGVFMADMGPNAGGLIGMLAPTDPLHWSEVASKEFIGMLVKSSRSQLVHCTPAGGDVLDGVGLFTDEEISSGETGDPTRGVTISLGAEISNGLYTVNLKSKEPGAPDEKMFMIAGKVDGKIVMFAFGGTDRDGTYNVLLVEKN